MTEDKVENLQEVLNERIGNNRKIVDTKISRLTAPGENYGSIMLKLEVKYASETTGSEEEIHAVAKTLPPDEFSRQVFDTQVTFKNEIAMYDTIVPTLQEFQRENGVKDVIDYVPALYGSRLNLDGKTDVVDDNAVLILENLFASGYTAVDRQLGFDLDTTKVILKNLAAFHAVPLALKIRKPDIFEKKVRPFLKPFDPPEFENNGGDPNRIFIEILQDSYKCIPFIPKVKEIFRRPKPGPELTIREPFATVIHGDMWVNNSMVMFKNDKPIKSKLVDFQVCDYSSPARDLFFFLFTSVRKTELEETFDDLIKFYHDHFIAHLENLHCSTAPFNFHNFIEEMRQAVRLEFQHTTIMMSFIVMAQKGGALKNSNSGKPPDLEVMKKDIRLEAKEQLRCMIQLCGSRGWL